MGALRVGCLRGWILTITACIAVGCGDDATTPAIGTRSDALNVTQEARLTRKIGVQADRFARSIAMHLTEAMIGASGESQNLPGQGVVRAYHLGGYEQRLTAPDASADDAFGSSLAIEGAIGFIGADQDDEAGAIDRGSVYVFTLGATGWTYTQKLLANDGAANDRFGGSVAVRGGTLVIGAPGRNGGRGSAYVFVQSGGTWTQQARLDAPSSSPGDAFGASVAVDTNTVVVGAPDYDAAGAADAGAAWIFFGSAGVWSVQHEALGPVVGGHRGSAVGVAGDRALIGAPHERSDGLGAVFALGRVGSTWTQNQELVASDGLSGDAFGQALSVEGIRLRIGAPARSNDMGATYSFQVSGSSWIQSAHMGFTFGSQLAGDEQGAVVAVSDTMTLSGMPGRNEEGAFSRWQNNAHQGTSSRSSVYNPDDLGTAVDLSNQTLIVGAPGLSREVYDESTHGAALVFVRNGTTWTEQAMLIPAGVKQGDKAGNAVAIEGDLAVVGVPMQHVGAGYDQGTARVFTRSGTVWTEVAALTAPTLKDADVFGSSVALDSGTLAVGAYARELNPNLVSQGTVSVFVGSGASWQLQAELTASDAKADDHFGIALALEGDLLLAGAPDVDTTVGVDDEIGAAYIFSRSGGVWTQEARLDGVPPATKANFGGAVAIFGGRLFIGAPGSIGGGTTPPGAVYVYSKVGGTWTLDQKVLSPETHNNDLFGIQVGASSGVMMAVGREIPTPGKRTLYTFTQLGATWTFDNKQVAPDELFGRLALLGDTVAVGAPTAPAGDSSGGAVYVYRTSSDCSAPGVTCCTQDSDCGASSYCDATGHCSPKKGLGATCNPAAECLVPATCSLCTSSFCVDGVCCDSGCTDACEACAGPAGICSPVAQGTLPTCTTNAVCDGVSATCPTTCAIDMDCKAGFYCDSGTCQPLQANGAVCAAGNACTSGNCVDGVCCSTACNGVCEACAASLQENPVADGTCAPAKTGTDPHGSCDAQNPDTCGTTGMCDGSGACAHFGPTTACGATVCANGAQDGQVCIAPNTCGPSGGPVSCFPYGCAGNACATSCLQTSDCVDPTYLCISGACVPGLQPGDVCSSAAECLSGFCSDGVCCNIACSGQCEACAEVGSEGACSVVNGDPRGDRPDCNGTGICTGACDGVDATQCHYPGTDTECAAGTCEDGSAHLAGTCDGAGACSEGDVVDCTPYTCAEGACNATCVTDEDCAPGFECLDGSCMEPVPPAPDAGCGDAGCACADGGCETAPPAPRPEEDEGCGCRVPAQRSSTPAWLVVLAVVIGVARRRRSPGFDSRR
jgi:MYXO-CTERM domain-containing protein